MISSGGGLIGSVIGSSAGPLKGTWVDVRRIRWLAGFAILLALLAAGCGTQEQPPPPDEPTPPPPPPPTATCDASRSGASPTGRTLDDLRETMAEGRIVGGIEAARGDWPFAAAIAFAQADGSLSNTAGVR